MTSIPNRLVRSIAVLVPVVMLMASCAGSGGDTEQAATAPFHTLFGGPAPLERRVAAVENGDTHRTTVAEVYERYESVLSDVSIELSVEEVGDSTAEVDLEILLRGEPTPLLPSFSGTAVKADGEWRVSEQTWCDVAERLESPCEGHERGDSKGDQPPEVASSENRGNCPTMEPQFPGSFELVETGQTGFSDEGRSRRYEDSAAGSEVTVLEQASIGVLDTEVLVPNGTVLIGGREATIRTEKDDRSGSVIVAWWESDECGLYGLVSLGIPGEEAAAFAKGLRVEEAPTG